MVNILIVFGLLSSLAAAQNALTPLIPDCASSTVTPVCVQGGAVVQSGSANPMMSVPFNQNWAFQASALARSINWRFFDAGTSLAPTACAGLNFNEVGSTETTSAGGTTTTGTIWFIVYLFNAVDVNQPLLSLTAANGCTYTYATSSRIKGGPIYFYTNYDNGAASATVSLRSQLNPPTRSNQCSTIPQDGNQLVSSIAIQTQPSLSTSLVLLQAGYVAAPPSSIANCFASFLFTFGNMMGPPPKGKGPGPNPGPGPVLGFGPVKVAPAPKGTKGKGKDDGKGKGKDDKGKGGKDDKGKGKGKFMAMESINEIETDIETELDLVADSIDANPDTTEVTTSDYSSPFLRARAITSIDLL